MLKVEFDYDQLQLMINEAINNAFQNQVSSNLPPLLTKTQLMDLLDIKNTKASELLNRKDFPVIREFGHPRVPTHSLLIWIDEHTEWIKDNAGEKWEQNKKSGAA